MRNTKQNKTMDQLTREIQEIEAAEEVLSSMGFERSDFQTFERDEDRYSDKMFTGRQVDVVGNNLDLLRKDLIHRNVKKYYFIFGTHFQVRAWGYIS